MSKLTSAQTAAKIKEPAAVEFIGFELGVTAFDAAQYKATQVKFQDCNFGGKFKLTKVDIQQGLQVQHCNFSDDIRFTNLISHHFFKTGEIPVIEFINCTFKKKVDLQHCKLTANISFLNCTFTDEFRGFEVENVGGEISLQNCNFEKDINLENIQAGEFKISECIVKNNLNLKVFNCNSISFTKLNLTAGELIFSSGSANKIELLKSEFTGQVDFNELDIKTPGLIMKESSFKNGFNILNKSENNTIQCIELNSGTFQGGMLVSFESQNKTESNIGELLICTGSMLTGNIAFNNLNIGKLEFRGYNSGTNLSFRKVAATEVIFNEYINTKELVFSDFRALIIRNTGDMSKLEIRDSNLGKAQFYQADLSSFKTITIKNVILAEIASFAVKWFSESQLKTAETTDLQMKLKKWFKRESKAKRQEYRTRIMEELNNRRELYRQLKYICQKQGDMPQALIFQASEMRQYNYMMSYQKPKNYVEYLIMVLSRTNDFGQNWIKAVVFLLVFSFIFYLPIGFLASSKLDYDNFARNWDDIQLSLQAMFHDNLKMWLVSLNPTHRVKDFSEKIDNYPSLIYLFDLLSRVVVSVFIFQVVSAFRKLSK